MKRQIVIVLCHHWIRQMPEFCKFFFRQHRLTHFTVILATLLDGEKVVPSMTAVIIKLLQSLHVRNALLCHIIPCQLWFNQLQNFPKRLDFVIRAAFTHSELFPI